MVWPSILGGGVGGGGYTRSLSKFKNTPKALISGYKKVPSFTKSRTCGSLKEDLELFFREICNVGAAPLCT